MTEIPPVEFENNKKKLLALNTSFIVLKIFDINDVEGTFDIQFMVHTQWFDKDLQFEYLKLDLDENSLPEKLYKKIWVPDLAFDDIDIDSSMSIYRKHIFVREDFLFSKIHLINIFFLLKSSGELDQHVSTETSIKFMCGSCMMERRIL